LVLMTKVFCTNGPAGPTGPEKIADEDPYERLEKDRSPSICGQVHTGQLASTWRYVPRSWPYAKGPGVLEKPWTKKPKQQGQDRGFVGFTGLKNRTFHCRHDSSSGGLFPVFRHGCDAAQQLVPRRPFFPAAFEKQVLPRASERGNRPRFGE